MKNLLNYVIAIIAVIALFIAILSYTRPLQERGPPGISGYEVIESIKPVKSGEYSAIFAQCSQGKKIIGGGCKADSTYVSVQYGGPITDLMRPGWTCIFFHDLEFSPNCTAHAICANVES